MVDSTEAMESQFVTADLVKSSPTKKLVIVDPGNYEKTDYGNKLTLKVNIDGKNKLWRPNIESVEAMQIFGKDTINWLSKPISLSVQKRSGKEAVIAAVEGQPTDKQPKQEEVFLPPEDIQ